jgi:3-isopropylmalate/(R)-2-methylmalate dehydratase small subunit
LTSEGRVWKFGDDVNTDLIIPGKYLDDYSPSHLSSHAMEGLDAGFAKAVMEGDVIVAGCNFGCGSSREQAVIALKGCGIRMIAATSFSRIFYRNAINLGLAVYESPEAHTVFEDGDRVELDTAEGRLRSLDGAKCAPLKDVPQHLREIIDSGGLLPYIRAKMSQSPPSE